MNIKTLLFFLNVVFYFSVNCFANSCQHFLSNLNVSLKDKSYSEVKVKAPSPKDLASNIWDSSGFSLLHHQTIPPNVVSSFFDKSTSNGSVVESGSHILSRRANGTWNIRPFYGMKSYNVLKLPAGFSKIIEYYYQQVMFVMEEFNMSQVGELDTNDMKFFIYRGESVFGDGKFERQYDDESLKIKPRGYVMEEMMGKASIVLSAQSKAEMHTAELAHKSKLEKMIDDANPNHVQRFMFSVTGILSPDSSGEPLMAFEGVEGNAVELNGSSALFNLSAPHGILQSNNPNFKEGIFFKFRFFLERDLNKIEKKIEERDENSVRVDVDSLFSNGSNTTETPSEAIEAIDVDELF